MTPPTLRATYRLQLNASFGFARTREILPYLADLGVSHLYLSPVFAARPGSEHGYDVVDHNRLNPELGSEAELEALVTDVRDRGMGLVLDFVPNHMGIGADNPWWADILEWGKASPYSRYFDIDWDPLEPTMAGKVLLPVLGDHYGTVLGAGALRLLARPESGTVVVEYGEQRFPLSPAVYAPLLRDAAERSGGAARVLRPLADEFEQAWKRRGRSGKDRRGRRERIEVLKGRLAEALERGPGAEALRATCREWSGDPDEPASLDRLHGLLEKQAYRLAYWRVAAHEINYRRFFDINDLAGLRMEDPELFDASHRLLRRLVVAGGVDGIRLDHVDGLRDPAGYFVRLRSLGEGKGGAPRVFVEKILGPGEHLRSGWAVDGTTGYEFMSLVGGLFVDPRGEAPLTRLYRDFTGEKRSFQEMAVEAKRAMIGGTLASELNVLASLFNRVAKRSRNTRDYTLTGLREALAGVVSHFPVYRTYVTGRGAGEKDRRVIERAVEGARRSSRWPDLSVYDFLRDVLTLDLLKGEGGYRRAEVVDAALRFQQYTGPVTAKAIEDTAFYRYLRAVWLNEVGGAPERFGCTPARFHEENHRRLRDHPDSMVATATHDHKRGEDVRARLAVLSEIPDQWGKAVRRWARSNRSLRSRIAGGECPGRGPEYLFYQTVVGAWPAGADPDDESVAAEFRDRLDAYMLKAAREAKVRTSWAAPDSEYEEGLSQFVRGVLAPGTPFLGDAAGFAERIAPAGAVNSLAQTVLKLTVPGVPDLYQGTERWDLSLVDPDNRRPVDYGTRRAALGERPEGPGEWEALLDSWRDGRVKQHLIARLLELRRHRSGLFARGEYLPLEVDGKHGDRVVAFARMAGEEAAVVIVPRLAGPPASGGRNGGGSSPTGELTPRGWPEDWEDACVRLPEGFPVAERTEIFTGRAPSASRTGRLAVQEALSPLPVAVIASVGVGSPEEG